MKTILKEATIKGICLMDGKDSVVNIFPSHEKGIKFFLNGEKIEADAFNVISTQNCFVLGNEKIKVRLVEHFMA
ncbi:MAG: UDP-3-O-acyl-N-acetylglucosamine deacetylase, partial [Candidatus Gastranaerophilaceae bacterium]